MLRGSVDIGTCYSRFSQPRLRVSTNAIADGLPAVRTVTTH